MTTSKISPLKDLARRGAGLIIRTHRHCLWGLKRFSREHGLFLKKYGNASKTLTMNGLREKGYPGIARALADNGIRAVDFTLYIDCLFPPPKQTDLLIARSIRVALRNLAAYGLPKTEQEGTLTFYLGDLIWLSSQITIKAPNQAHPQIMIRVDKEGLMERG